MMRFPLPLLSALFCLLLALAAPAQERFEAPASGFAITVNVDGWKHQAQESGGRVAALGIGPPELGGLAQITIQITESTEQGLAASKQTVDALLAQVEAVPGIEVGERFEMKLGGETAVGVAVKQSDSGVDFRVRLMFLHANGFQYRVQFHSPQDNWDEHWPKAEKVLATFELIEPNADAQARRSLRELAARCGSQIDWAADWQEAAARAKEQQRLIVVAIHSIPGFDLGSPLMQGPFMDEEIVTLMQNRFVGYVWKKGNEAPFADHDVFGLSGTTFGTGLLIVTPSGEVVRQIYLVDGMLAATALREVLQGHPQLKAAAPPADLNRAAQVAHAIGQGQLDLAREWAGPAPGSDLAGAPKSESPELALQRARLARMERKGALGLHALDHASATDSIELTAAIQLERARIHTGMGDYASGLAALEALPEVGLSEKQRAELLTQRATLKWATAQRESAIADLETVCQELPNQPLAWSAAAVLTGPAVKMETVPDVSWPDDYAFEAARLGPAAPAIDVVDPAQAIPAGVNWLLAHQLDNGTWLTPSGIGDPQQARDPITMASTAIALQALFEYASTIAEDQPERAAEVREAAFRGLTQYLAFREVVRANPREVAFMDYTCWGSSYGAFLLTTVLDQFAASEINPSRHQLGRIRRELTFLLSDLVRIQQQNGGWSYYLSGEIGGEATVAAMSFTTATVLQALERGRAHEFEVAAEVLDRGYDCLAKMRGSNGAFEYLTMGPNQQQAGEVEILGGAARGPLCTHALVAAGRLDAADMVLPFERYVEHLHTYGMQSRRALMHCGPQAQGSHYLTYDYATASDALAAYGDEVLSDQLRNEAREETLRQLARCLSADGSFIDNPILGPVAGTGLALQAMLSLRDQG